MQSKRAAATETYSCVNKKANLEHSVYVKTFLDAVHRVNDFFFGLSDGSAYCSGALIQLNDHTDGSEDSQLGVKSVVEETEMEYEIENGVPIVPAVLTSSEKVLKFYSDAVYHIMASTYAEEENFTNERFNFPRLLNLLVDLSLRKDNKKLESFLEQMCEYAEQDTSSFWRYMDRWMDEEYPEEESDDDCDDDSDTSD